jgi:hypothetical protein
MGAPALAGGAKTACGPPLSLIFAPDPAYLSIGPGVGVVGARWVFEICIEGRLWWRCDSPLFGRDIATRSLADWLGLAAKSPVWFPNTPRGKADNGPAIALVASRPDSAKAVSFRRHPLSTIQCRRLDAQS